MKDGTAYKNKQTGHVYFFVCEAIDCTKSRDGTSVAIYKYQGDVYVREMVEFLQEFEEVKE